MTVIDPVSIPLLKEIPRRPSQLYILGDEACLAGPCIAIVGTRRADAYSMRAAYRIARFLAEQGLVVASGLALGIDAQAHLGALDGNGKTVAVVAHGLDTLYPRQHRALSERILEQGGCIVSEYELGVPVLKHHFPMRNRIISGLSLATVVVQAAKRSGSLITAKCALDQNRDVFVVPGNFGEPSYEGSHELINEGAQLLVHPEDIMKVLHLECSETSMDGPTLEIGKYFLNDPELSLVQLQDRSHWPLSKISKHLEHAQSLGLIQQTAPQQYLWLGVVGSACGAEKEVGGMNWRTALTVGFEILTLTLLPNGSG